MTIPSIIDMPIMAMLRVTRRSISWKHDFDLLLPRARLKMRAQKRNTCQIQHDNIQRLNHLQLCHSYTFPLLSESYRLECKRISVGMQTWLNGGKASPLTCSCAMATPPIMLIPISRTPPRTGSGMEASRAAACAFLNLKCEYIFVYSSAKSLSKRTAKLSRWAMSETQINMDAKLEEVRRLNPQLTFVNSPNPISKVPAICIVIRLATWSYSLSFIRQTTACHGEESASSFCTRFFIDNNAFLMRAWFVRAAPQEPRITEFQEIELFWLRQIPFICPILPRTSS